jgi:hypothetical protein
MSERVERQFSQNTMKTTTLLPAVALAAIISGTAGWAQENAAPAPDNANTQVAQPGTPAPTPVNGFVYVAKLPTPTQLLKDAEAEGLTIARMEQGPDRLLVVYQYPNGSSRSFVYTTSPVSVANAAPLSNQLATATYTVVSPPPGTVVYPQPQTVYYAPSYVRYYDPAWDFWAPLAVGVGLGWGFGGHGWHGGWHGHGGWHH